MLATLNALGWTFMLVSMSAVAGLTFWCFRRVLTGTGDEPELPGGLGP